MTIALPFFLPPAPAHSIIRAMACGRLDLLGGRVLPILSFRCSQGSPTMPPALRDAMVWALRDPTRPLPRLPAKAVASQSTDKAAAASSSSSSSSSASSSASGAAGPAKRGNRAAVDRSVDDLLTNALTAATSPSAHELEAVEMERHTKADKHRQQLQQRREVCVSASLCVDARARVGRVARVALVARMAPCVGTKAVGRGAPQARF
jgi:hypothetical protein